MTSFRSAGAAVAILSLLLLAGCGGSAADAPASTPGATSTAAASTCVADPAAVVARTSPATTTPMPEELAATAAAARRRRPPGSGRSRVDVRRLLEHEHVLLGKVIEEVSGVPFQDELQERILTPLGLDDTSFPAGSPAYPDPHPQGFTLQGDVATPEAPVDATDWNPSWGWTAGEMISTASDLLVYARDEATGNGLVPQAEQIARLTSFPGSAGYGIGMGCSAGWSG